MLQCFQTKMDNYTEAIKRNIKHLNFIEDKKCSTKPNLHAQEQTESMLWSVWFTWIVDQLNNTI